MSHCAPTVWAQVPVLATNWAIHRARNHVCRSGAQADGTAAREGSGPGVSRRTSTTSTIPGPYPPRPYPRPDRGLGRFTQLMAASPRWTAVSPAARRSRTTGSSWPSASSMSRQPRSGTQPSSLSAFTHEIPDASVAAPAAVARPPEVPSDQVVQRQAVGVVRGRRVDDLVPIRLRGHGGEQEVGQVVDDDVGPERGARVLASCPHDRADVALDVALPLDPCRADRHGGDVRPGDGGVHRAVRRTTSTARRCPAAPRVQLVDGRVLGVEVPLRVREARHGLAGDVYEAPYAGPFGGLQRGVGRHQVGPEDLVRRVLHRAGDPGRVHDGVVAGQDGRGMPRIGQIGLDVPDLARPLVDRWQPVDGGHLMSGLEKGVQRCSAQFSAGPGHEDAHVRGSPSVQEATPRPFRSADMAARRGSRGPVAVRARSSA